MLNSTAVTNTESITKRQEKSAYLEDVVGQIGCCFHFRSFCDWKLSSLPRYLFIFPSSRLAVYIIEQEDNKGKGVGELGL